MIRLEIVGDLRRHYRDEARGLKRDAYMAVAEAGAWLKAELRGQIDSARLGRRLARTWQLRVYRNRDDSAALVYSRAPNIVRAFELGATIRARSGRYLAIPTGFNRKGGRRGAAVLVTPRQMLVPGASFATRAKGGALLWWYRIERASRLRQTTRRGHARFHRTGVTDAFIEGHRMRDRRRRELAVGYGAVPMFILVRQIKLRKRLDIASAAARALDRAANGTERGAA